MSEPKQTNWVRSPGTWTSGIPDDDEPPRRDPIDKAIDGEVAKQDEQERKGP